MADEPAAPPADPAKAADPAPAPSGDPSAASTLLTQGDPKADPAKADPAKAEPPKADPAKPVVPEKYDFSTAKLPEGITLAPELVDAVSPLLKEFGLTQEQATKLVEAHAAALAKVTATAEQQSEADFKQYMQDTAKANVEAIRKEWGHEHEANLKIAQRGIARFVDAEGKRLLDETGLGNHPSFLKAFLAAGKMIQEDTPPPNGQPSGRKPSAEVLYPNTPGAGAAH